MDSLNGESNNSGDSDIDKGSPLSLAAGDRGIDDKDIGDNELVPRDYQVPHSMILIYLLSMNMISYFL